MINGKANGLEWGTNGYTNTCVALRGVLTLFDLLFSNKWDDDPQRRERVQEPAQATSSGMAQSPRFADDGFFPVVNPPWLGKQKREYVLFWGTILSKFEVKTWLANCGSISY
jgi:hypothetical protein